MFWSQITIPGKPRLLVVDGSRNVLGWESEFCDRISNVLVRKEVDLVGGGAARIDRPKELAPLLRGQQANCIFLLCHAHRQDGQTAALEDYWKWLAGQDSLAEMLLAVCTYEEHDAETAQAIMGAGDSFAKLAVAQQSDMSLRAAGLFYMKFFTELDLHAYDSITGKMVWFSHSKAREILKRRNLPGRMGLRC